MFYFSDDDRPEQTEAEERREREYFRALGEWERSADYMETNPW